MCEYPFKTGLPFPAVLKGTGPLMRAGPTTRLNLPSQPTSFLGREDEIAGIIALLRAPDCHLLTLVGPGGIGKTRLAIEVARRQELFDDVYLVLLQPLRSFHDLVTTIVEMLPLQLHGSTDAQQLIEYLRRQKILMILDNFEHLLDGVGLVTDVLNGAPHVKLLVTSRESLHLQAEYLWPVRGLDTPPDGGLEDFDRYGAVQLFVERAQRVKPDFSPHLYKHEIGRICRLTGGMPLALELAASWTRTLNPRAIGDEIQRSVAFLSTSQRDMPDRHRSMRAVFEHSWHLLAEGDQARFSALSVFRGGFTMDAAQQVAGATLQDLAALIDKSLVQTDDRGRYDLHDLLRQFAKEKLEAAGADSRTSENHCVYYATFIQERVEDLKGHRQIVAIPEINTDFENLRRAWMWAAEHGRMDYVEQMIDGLYTYSRNGHRVLECNALFLYAAERCVHQQGEPQERLWGRLLARSGRDNDPRPRLETALTIADKYNDRAEIALCLYETAYVAYAHQEYTEAVRLFEQCLSIYRQLGDAYGTARTLFSRVTFDHQEDWERKKVRTDELLRLQREIGDHVGIGWSLALMALHEGRLGHFSEAERLWMEQVEFGQEMGNLAMVATGYGYLGQKVYFFRGDFPQAHDAAVEAIRLGTEIGYPSPIGLGLATTGLLASMNGEYAEGRRLCLEAVAATTHDDIQKSAAWGLAVAFCGLGQYEEARAQLSIALRYLSNVQGVVGEIASLPVASIVLAHQGYPIRAAEMLALALSHPIAESSWMKQWPLLARLRGELEQTVGTEEVAAAWTRGKQLNLHDVMIEIRRQFPGPDSVTIRQVRQSLPDPLSPRELEVLALIADGLTNHGIAKRLFIGVSTVKKHIQHIYAKLDATNRTGAVQRARESHLLP